MRWRGIVRGRREGRAPTPTIVAADGSLPLPPMEMRQLIGPTDPAAFDNPSGAPVYPYLPPEAHRSVLDFGCGCGRVARQLIQQVPRPERYLGVDLHRGMVEWCRANLAPAAPGFDFVHHDVFNYSFNPGDKPDVLPLPAEAGEVTLVNAISVFTHVPQPHVDFYLGEARRVLTAEGILQSSWFLVEREHFPMLSGDHPALYASYVDPSAAVVFTREWVLDRARAAGFTVYDAIPPSIRGYQWILLMTPTRDGVDEVELPHDEAPVGAVDLPDMPANPSRVGLD